MPPHFAALNLRNVVRRNAVLVGNDPLKSPVGAYCENIIVGKPRFTVALASILGAMKGAISSVASFRIPSKMIGIEAWPVSA